jgi:hypothetical protein
MNDIRPTHGFIATLQSQGWLYGAMFLAIAALESIPRFSIELLRPLPILQRLVLLLLFFGSTWFFTHAIHGEMRWNVLSQMFFADAMITAVLAVFLIGQIVFPLLAYVTLVIIICRALLFSYLVSYRLPQLRGLVFGTSAILLTIGEFIITVGISPF